MSKVYEALKRAQEDRSLVPGGADDNIEASSGISIPDPSIANLSARVTAVVAPTVTTPLVEDRADLPTIGRDPRTAQFLRFEDLLRTCAKPAWLLDPGTVVFCPPSMCSSAAEQFRTLRTRLYQVRETSPLKKVLITSALAGEGKTFIATNLAQAIAQEHDRRVLLIDADLRNPTLHWPLGAPSGPGLSDFLQDQASESDITQHGQEGNLCFIPAGNSGTNASELLSNGRFGKLLDRIAPLFDWVIIDSPPCLPVADANFVAGLCDGVLLVVRAKSTPSVAVLRARQELQKRKVLGAILNVVEESDTYGGQYRYGGSGRAGSSNGVILGESRA